MKYCQNCGTLLEENAKFCQSCGTPVAEEQPECQAETSEAEAAPFEAEGKPAGKGPVLPGESQTLGAETVQGKKTGSPKRTLRLILCCVLIVVVVAVVFVQCSGTSKAQILETAKTFTLDNSDVTLGEAAETNLSNVEWTCYKADDGYWTVTLSGYNPNEDATVTLLIGVAELNETEVSYEVIYGEVNGTGSDEADDINYAIAIVYDNVGQALVNSLTSYLLGL